MYIEMQYYTFLFICIIFNVGTALVCHECGIPGATSCEVARDFNILIAVNNCHGTCASTSYRFATGERITSRFCNYNEKLCDTEGSENMNINTCKICKSDFCNGHIPPCSRQLMYVERCVGHPHAVGWVLAACAVVIVIFTGVLIYKRCRKREVTFQTPLVTTFQASRTIELDGMQYTAL